MSERYDQVAESQYVNGQLPKWTDQLRPASFRDVPFHVDSIEWTAGDNVVVREYPFQDLPTIFRMGAAAQELKFSAYVIGSDYHLQRDALMRALSGPGRLMHPTAGVLQVYAAGKYTVREAPTFEGGMARFDLHFVVAEPRRYPVAAANTQATAATKADTAKTAAASSYAAQLAGPKPPGWAAQQAVARIKAGLDGVIGPIRKAAATANSFIAEVNASYRAVVNGLDSLLSAPRQLADAITQIYRLPSDLSNAAARDFQAAFAWGFRLDQQLPRRSFEVSVVPPVGTGLVLYGTGQSLGTSAGSAGQQQLDAMLTAGDLFLETLAAAAYVQATAAVELGDYDEAMAMRQAVHDQLVRLMQAASAAQPALSLPGNSLHDALLAMHGAALADLQARSRDLVRLSTYTPGSWQPVWYISHRLYGTAAYADELLALNPHIRHPLLVPPGRALRVARHD